MQKIKKGGAAPPNIELVPTIDILAAVAAQFSGAKLQPYIVGFAAETNDLDANASAKRKKKRIPLMVGNIAQYALGAEENELVVYDDNGSTRLPRAEKLVLARQLIAVIAQRISEERYGC